MFFPERIKSIKASDKVLEIGPGGTPFYRSDVLLEKIFDEEVAREQRGHAKSLNTEKELVFYEGGQFPFKNKEFDYVICSHVLEHIRSDEIEKFVAELERVANKGYIEFPTIYYEYLYNFKVHTTFLNFKSNAIWYMGKNQSRLDSFFSIQKFFYKTLECGHDEIIRENKEYFFQGFEWENEIVMIKTSDIEELCAEGVISKNRKKTNFRQSLKSKLQKIFKCGNY
ncbi:MAG: methyltransferase domain-containing protein [Cycloclasticus sp.]